MHLIKHSIIIYINNVKSIYTWSTTCNAFTCSTLKDELGTSSTMTPKPQFLIYFGKSSMLQMSACIQHTWICWRGHHHFCTKINPPWLQVYHNWETPIFNCFSASYSLAVVAVSSKLKRIITKVKTQHIRITCIYLNQRNCQ